MSNERQRVSTQANKTMMRKEDTLCTHAGEDEGGRNERRDF